MSPLKESLAAIVERIERDPLYQRPAAFGVGLANLDSKGKILDVFYPQPNFQSNYATAAILARACAYKSGSTSHRLSLETLDAVLSCFGDEVLNDRPNHPNADVLCQFRSLLATGVSPHKAVVASFIAPAEQDEGPSDSANCYLRLHLLSHRLVRPNALKLNNMFAVLPNIAWTSEGPIAAEELNARRMQALARGETLVVHAVDKIPALLNYVLPSGVRIADGARVRLGAYLGEGTTVMQEGFINFNAGCEGPNMVEGRISAGVFVEKGSDIGGGASTMGTLSGGGKVVLSVGQDCLLGANSGLGIPLGHRCTVEAGLYLTAGTKVVFAGKTYKARDFAGKDDLLFRRNSLNGQVEVLPKSNEVTLNLGLHANT